MLTCELMEINRTTAIILKLYIIIISLIQLIGRLIATLLSLWPIRLEDQLGPSSMDYWEREFHAPSCVYSTQDTWLIETARMKQEEESRR